MSTPGERQTRRQRVTGFFWVAYQQVAAVLAVFALIAFASHFIHFEWTGFADALVAQWNDYVRPAMKWLLDFVVTKPLHWFGWRFEVPLLARDYLAVGLTMALSLLRSTRATGSEPDMYFVWRPWTDGTSVSEVVVATLTFWPPSIAFLWPIAIVLLPIAAVTDKGNVRESFIAVGIILAPVLYFCLLIAVNYLIL